MAASATPFRASPLGTSPLRTGRPLLVAGQGLLEFFYLLRDLLPAVTGGKEHVVRVVPGLVPGVRDALQACRLALLVLLQVLDQQGVGLGAEIIHPRL